MCRCVIHLMSATKGVLEKKNAESETLHRNVMNIPLFLYLYSTCKQIPSK